MAATASAAATNRAAPVRETTSVVSGTPSGPVDGTGEAVVYGGVVGVAALGPVGRPVPLPEPSVGVPVPSVGVPGGGVGVGTRGVPGVRLGLGVGRPGSRGSGTVPLDTTSPDGVSPTRRVAFGSGTVRRVPPPSGTRVATRR